MYQIFRNPQQEALDGIVDILFEKKSELLVENSSTLIKHLQHLEDLVMSDKEKFINTVKGIMKIARQHESDGDTMVVEKVDGCLHPDTVIKTKDGDKTIYQIITEFRSGISNEVLTYNEEEKINEYNLAQNPRINNKGKEWIQINLENGFFIRCTKDHKFYTKNRGWVEGYQLTSEDDILEMEKNDE